MTLVADRTYLDGADLYLLDQMNIRFVVIAKTHMAAYGTALCKSVEADTYYDRTETLPRGQERDQTSETLLTRLQTVTHMRTWDRYRLPPTAGKQLRITDRPALNAVLVRLWQNKTPDSPASSSPINPF